MTVITIDEDDIVAIGLVDAQSVAFVNARPDAAGVGKYVEVPLRRDSFELIAGVSYRISFRRAPAIQTIWTVAVPEVEEIGLAELIGFDVARTVRKILTKSPAPSKSRNGGWITYPPKDA